MKIGILFPGQASQSPGMGVAIADQFPEAAEVFETGRRVTGMPLLSLCRAASLSELTATIVCQPTVFAASLACWNAFRPVAGGAVAGMAGHSLGEYSALVAAGAMSLEDGFVLVRRRAEAMEEISRTTRGGMLAVLGAAAEDVEELRVGSPGIEISNLNAPGQVVVAGEMRVLEDFSARLRDRGFRSRPLAVGGPFHSSFMAGAATAVEEVLKTVALRDPGVPVYANRTGQAVRVAGDIPRMLVEQMTHAVLWTDTIRRMIADGIEAFVEVGPGRILKGLVGRIAPGVAVYNVEDPATLAATASVLTGNA